MKANAPEKIYLEWYRIGDKKYRDWCIIPKTNDESVEYIRADAFIEKACFWLRTHSEGDYFELIPDANYCGAGNLNKKRMIEDFKKAMKGE